VIRRNSPCRHLRSTELDRSVHATRGCCICFVGLKVKSLDEIGRGAVPYVEIQVELEVFVAAANLLSAARRTADVVS